MTKLILATSLLLSTLLLFTGRNSPRIRIAKLRL